MSGIFEITAPEAYQRLAPYPTSRRWPWAGEKLTPELMQLLGLPDDMRMPDPTLMGPSLRNDTTHHVPHGTRRGLAIFGARRKPDFTGPLRSESTKHTVPITRIVLKGTGHDYLVSNGYLLPYYSPSLDREERGDLQHRNEELIIDRARALTHNAQPELGAVRTRKQIQQDLGSFLQMPEDTHVQRMEKAAAFKITVGSIITRQETLGRITTQRNAHGARIEYADIRSTSQNPQQVLDEQQAALQMTLDALPEQMSRDEVRALLLEHSQQLGSKLVIAPERIAELRQEFGDYYKMLTDEAMLPLLRTVLFTDKKVDRDGVLIDYIREIGKPMAAQTDRVETVVRDGIINKIGHAVGSIDEMHGALRNAISRPPMAALFESSIQKFIEEQGEVYGVRDVRDVYDRFDRFAAHCRARACVRSDDDAYADVFTGKAVEWGFFMGENGLLQSMRRVGRNMGVEVQELRDILSRGMRIMERTAYTRTPCNAEAPEIWIPNFSEDAPPMEQYLIDQFMNNRTRERARKIVAVAEEGLMEPKDVQKYLRMKFCSLGIMKDDLYHLSKQVQEKDPKEQDAARGR